VTSPWIKPNSGGGWKSTSRASYEIGLERIAVACLPVEKSLMVRDFVLLGHWQSSTWWGEWKCSKKQMRDSFFVSGVTKISNTLDLARRARRPVRTDPLCSGV
jgi:ABC-type cobalamin/Fe3+-siderophores transport system ATPase subunit